MSADLNDPRGSLRAKFRQHTHHRAVFHAPRGGGTPLSAARVSYLVPRMHPLVLPICSPLVVVSFASAIYLHHHPLSVSALHFAALSAPAFQLLIHASLLAGMARVAAQQAEMRIRVSASSGELMTATFPDS